MPASRNGTIRSAVSIAVRVALIYLVLGLAWIFGSDLYLYHVAGGSSPVPTAQILKGSAFVAASAIVVFALVYWFNSTSHVERRRRETVERGYRALIDSTPDAVFTIDPDSGRILDVNRAAEELFGLSRHQLIGLERSSHTDTDDPAFRAYQEERKRTGRTRAVLRMIRGDGSRFPADVSSAVFHDEAGRERASVVIRDITDRIKREQALEASEARLSELANLQHAILNSVFAHIALVNDDGTVEFANERWRENAGTGLLPELGADIGSNFSALCESYQGPESGTARRITGALRDVQAGRTGRVEFEFPYLHDDQRRWRRIAITPFAGEGQKGAVVAHLDVTDRRRTEARMRLVDAAFQSTDDAILICDENFLIQEANEAYLRITGFDWKDALEAKPPFLEIGEQARAVGQALAKDGYWHGDLLQRRVSGETFVSRAAVNVVRQSEEEPQRLVVAFSDVSALREAEQRVHHLSYHDPITNLPNRAALEEWFAQNVREASGGRSLALIYLDLDRFKTINESFGHGVGDELLKVIAGRLKTFIGPRDALGRLGGDEFLVVADGIDTNDDAVRFAHRLLEVVAKPMTVGSRDLVTTASAGISLYPRDALSLEELLREADAALDQVKREHRSGGISSFKPEMRQAVDRQMRLERGLRFALERHELELAFQPIVSLDDTVLLAAEALVRWNSPELGRVPPNEFIPVAEDAGLITEIGYWVFEQACLCARRWRGLATRFEHVAVNVSTTQFQQPGLVEQIETLLKRHKLPGSMFVLEITESIMMLNPDWTIEVLERLRSLGLRIAIDDFGTGYSSLTYLRQLPVDYLKLDKSFIARLPDSEADAHIMHAVIDLAHRLGIRVVAEGIETEAQLALLREWGCDEGQGFFLARPASAESLDRMLAEGRLQLRAKDTGEAPE